MLSILFAFIGYSILNISQATQKIGLKLAEQKKISGWALWLAATAGTSLSVFAVYYAVALGRASLVGAITPTGLVSLAVFSYLVMKERLNKKEMAGILLILCGAALIAVLSREPTDVVIYLDRLFLLSATVCALYLAALVLFFRKQGITGILLGGLAGALGGLIPLFQKVSSASLGRESAFFQQAELENFAPVVKFLLTYFANPYALIWIGLSLVSVAVLQFSYKRNKAMVIIPSFSANATLIPVVGGVICFAEELHPLQWLGVAVIVCGLFLLTVKINFRRKNLENPG